MKYLVSLVILFLSSSSFCSDLFGQWRVVKFKCGSMSPSFENFVSDCEDFNPKNILLLEAKGNPSSQDASEIGIVITVDEVNEFEDRLLTSSKKQLHSGYLIQDLQRSESDTWASFEYKAIEKVESYNYLGTVTTNSYIKFHTHEAAKNGRPQTAQIHLSLRDISWKMT